MKKLSEKLKRQEHYLTAISDEDTDRLSLYTHELDLLAAPKTPNVTSWKTTLTAVDATFLAKLLDCTLSEKAKILFTQALIIS